MNFSSYLSFVKYKSGNDMVKGREYDCPVVFSEQGRVWKHVKMSFSLDGLVSFLEENGNDIFYLDRCLCLQKGNASIKIAPPVS